MPRWTRARLLALAWDLAKRAQGGRRRGASWRRRFGQLVRWRARQLGLSLVEGRALRRAAADVLQQLAPAVPALSPGQTEPPQLILPLETPAGTGGRSP